MTHECLLILKIGSKYYRLEKIAGTVGVKSAWRLTKPDGESYTVSLGKHGPTCECWDWIQRKQNTPDPRCKHIRAVEQVGLMETNLGDEAVGN